MRQLFRQLASESMVYGLSTAAGGLVTVLLVPFYTRVLSTTEYGVVALFTMALALVNILAVMALDNSAHRWFWDSEEIADRKATIASWAWCHLAAATVLASIITLLAEPLARLITGSDGYGVLLRIGGWAVPAAVPAVVAVNWLRMQRRPWATLALTLGTALAGVGLTILMVAGLERGVRGVFEAQLIAAIAGAGVALVLLRDWLRPRYVQVARLGAMLRFALPLIPAAIAFWLVSMADRLFIQHFVSTDQVAVYQVGFVVASVVALFSIAFQQAWGPFALSIHRRPDAPGFYARALLAYVWVMAGIACAASLFAPEILRLLATPAYFGAGLVVVLLAFSYLMIGLSYIAGLGPSIARATGPTGVALTGAALINIALNLVLTPRLGKEGAALATLLSHTLACVYLFVWSQRLFPIPYRFGAAVGILVLAGAITAAGTAIPASPLLVGVFAKLALLALFIPALFVFGVATPGELWSALGRGSARVAA